MSIKNAIIYSSGGVDISDADASIADVVASKTFYATSGGKKTGTMPDNGTVSTDISAKATEVTIAAGKHSGSGKVKIAQAEQDKIIAGNIKKDISILGVTGTLEGASSGTYRVRFIDIDGTVLKTEYVNSGGNATAPSNPTKTYLTFNSWNTTYTNVTRNLDVGATYDVTDGKTYLFCCVTPSTGLSPTLYANNGTTALMTIDWGDSTTSTSSSSGNVSFAHTYSAEGNYTITITCSGGYSLGQGGSTTQVFTGNYSQIVKSCYIGSNVTSISNYTFSYCQSLTSVSIPSGVTSIGTYSFRYCYSLTFVSIPSGVTSIGNNTFYYCQSLTSVSIPSGVTSIGNSVFYYCYVLQSISIPSGVTSIGSSTFYSCQSLTSVVIPSGVTSISDTLFQSCYSLTSVSIPSGVTSIGNSVFQNCFSLISVSIPSGVTSIGSFVFNNCFVLTSLSIPSGVTSIAASAFQNCYTLKDYQIAATTPPSLAATSAFTGINLITKIYVPDASVSTYKAATNWSTYANYIYPISTR